MHPQALRSFVVTASDLMAVGGVKEGSAVPEGKPIPKKEIHKVYKDVAKKYPALAEKTAGAEALGIRLGEILAHTYVAELEKQALMGGLGQRLVSSGSGALKGVGEHLVRHGNKYDLGGLGVLAAPAVAGLGHAGAQAVRGQRVDKKELGHNVAETVGLGMIAAPVAAASLLGRKH